MKFSERIAQFFQSASEAWEAVPSYVKVFLYSTISSIVGLHQTGNLSVGSVLWIVGANLGLYSVSRGTDAVSKKLNS